MACIGADVDADTGEGLGVMDSPAAVSRTNSVGTNSVGTNSVGTDGSAFASSRFFDFATNELKIFKGRDNEPAAIIQMVNFCARGDQMGRRKMIDFIESAKLCSIASPDGFIPTVRKEIQSKAFLSATTLLVSFDTNEHGNPIRQGGVFKCLRELCQGMVSWV